MPKPYTAGPWNWVDSEDDEALDLSDGMDPEWRMSLRTVEHFGEDKTTVIEGKSYTSFSLPKFIFDAESFGAGAEQNAANARLVALAPELADYIYERAAAGNPLAEKLVAKIEARDTAPTP